MVSDDYDFFVWHILWRIRLASWSLWELSNRTNELQEKYSGVISCQMPFFRHSDFWIWVGLFIVLIESELNSR